MKRADVVEHATDSSGDSSADSGLPFFRTWKAVYLFVLGSFILWVALLIWLTKTYS